MAMDDPYELSAEVYKSEAYKIWLRLDTLAINWFVYERNYQKLSELLVASERPESHTKIWIQERDRERMIVMREIVRLFQNYLASAKSLVDHTRKLVEEWYSGSVFFEEYNIEVKERFRNSEIASFIKGLRNYTLHYSLPFTTAYLHYTWDPDIKKHLDTRSFVLEKERLMKWQKWDALSKSYLRKVEREIIILDLIKEYHKKVSDFHYWIADSLHMIHLDEVVWLDKMHERIEKALEEEKKFRPKFK